MSLSLLELFSLLFLYLQYYSGVIPTLGQGHDQIDSACVAVVGVGYVGETLLKEFGGCYNTIGFDVSPARVAHLQTIYGAQKNITLTTDESILDKATHYLVSVPTLLKDDYSVDLTHLENALSMVIAHAREGCTVVIESSVMVGTTRTLLGPLQEILHCGMSPERVDPGRVAPAAHEIPKIISGLTDTALGSIKTLYGRVFDKVVPVSKPEVAEFVKLYENCYRMVNVAYANEAADACRAHGIDPMEMIGAAATKPYGFQTFTPGLGVGGHCIPVNPFYLLANNHLPLLQEAAITMHDRPKMLARKMFDAFVESTETVRAPRVLVVGVGFKPGQSVLSYSPGISLARGLEDEGCTGLRYYDPLVSQKQVNFMSELLSDQWEPEYLKSNFDIVAIAMKQHGVDMSVLKSLPEGLVHYF